MSKIGSNPKISQDTYVKKTQILILKIKERLIVFYLYCRYPTENILS